MSGAAATPGTTTVPTTSTATNSYGIPSSYITYMAVVTWVVPFILTFYIGVVVLYYFNSLGLKTYFRNSLIVSALLLIGVLVYAAVYNSSQQIPLPTPVIMSLAGCIAGIIPVYMAFRNISGGATNNSLSGGNNTIHIANIGNNANRNGNNANRNGNNANRK
jgi:hypothetical protein